MSGRSRRWVCCLAFVVLTALGGWRVADAGAPALTAPFAAVAAVAERPYVAPDATSLHSGRVVAEPVAARRLELGRLLVVAVAIAAVVLALSGCGPAPAEHRSRWRLDRSPLCSRGPPRSFVSRP